MMNSSVPKHNTSGFKGVSRNSIGQEKPWIAQIKVDGLLRCLGVFYTKEEAYEAYCKAAEIHFGEFARTA